MAVTVIPRDNSLAEQIADFFRRAVEEERYRQALEASQAERRANFAVQTAMLPTDVAASVMAQLGGPQGEKQLFGQEIGEQTVMADKAALSQGGLTLGGPMPMIPTTETRLPKGFTAQGDVRLAEEREDRALRKEQAKLGIDKTRQELTEAQRATVARKSQAAGMRPQFDTNLDAETFAATMTGERALQPGEYLVPKSKEQMALENQAIALGMSVEEFRQIQVADVKGKLVSQLLQDESVRTNMKYLNWLMEQGKNTQAGQALSPEQQAKIRDDAYRALGDLHEPFRGVEVAYVDAAGNPVTGPLPTRFKEALLVGSIEGRKQLAELVKINPALGEMPVSYFYTQQGVMDVLATAIAYEAGYKSIPEKPFISSLKALDKEGRRLTTVKSSDPLSTLTAHVAAPLATFQSLDRTVYQIDPRVPLKDLLATEGHSIAPMAQAGGPSLLDSRARANATYLEHTKVIEALKLGKDYPEPGVSAIR